MELKKYLEMRKETTADFARKLGVTHGSVNRYIAGRLPAPDVIVKIRKATRGAVQPNDFYESVK